MNVGRMVARAIVGSLFVGHGTQKLMGWFDGPGLAGTDGMMESLNMRPARRNSLAAGVTETAGGALVTLGAATPLAAAGLMGVMITAIRKVHLPNGPWAAKGGYEYNLVLIAALLAIVDDGPGDLSVDAALGWDKHGAAWALGALAAGAAISTLVVTRGAQSGSPAQAAA